MIFQRTTATAAFKAETPVGTSVPVINFDDYPQVRIPPILPVGP